MLFFFSEIDMQVDLCCLVIMSFKNLSEQQPAMAQRR